MSKRDKQRTWKGNLKTNSDKELETMTLRKIIEQEFKGKKNLASSDPLPHPFPLLGENGVE